MSEKRTGVGLRLLSMLLVVVMVLGMAPLHVFAAEATPQPRAEQTNLEKIQAYAQNLFDANFNLSLDYGSKEFSWSTEGNKKHKWTYFDGLMVDAYLAMGMAGSKGNILEFASNYYNTQLTEAGVIRRFNSNATLDKEVDSVPPALGLFDLLGTVADEPKFHTVLHDMYKALQGYDTLANVGGNFRHKENTNWATYPFALDGLYMALPFLMEYAKAIDDGRLENTNNITPSAVYDDVIARLAWVATNMKDPNTGLYFHGVQENGTTMNGHFWSRAIGWYAVALVDVIGLLPEDKRGELTVYLDDLFDGMLTYQDATTGLWYNVPDKDSTLTNNYLETSGSALMAYALMKAYNNGWISGGSHTEQEYGQAGLKAFDGIVENKLQSGQIVDIYRSAGVETTDAGYLDTSKMSGTEDEAKGVGGVLLAATQVEKTQQKLAGGAGALSVTPTGGMVKAPAGLTVAVGGTPNYSDVKASIVNSDGTITNVSGSDLTCTMGDAANGKATVTATYEGINIGTFEVNVVDPTAPISANGTVTIGGTTEGSNQYKRVTTLTPGKNYVLTASPSSSTRAAGADFALVEITGANTPTGDVYTLSEGAGHWQIDSENRIFTVDANGTKQYIQIFDTSSKDRQLVTDAAQATVFTITEATDHVQITATVNGKTRALKIDSNGLVTSSSGSVYLFEQVAGNSQKPVNLSVEPNTVNMTLNGTSALTTKVTVDGSPAVNPAITWTSSNTGVVTVENGTLTAVAAGTATVTATLKAVTIDDKSTNLDEAITVSITVNVMDGTTPEKPVIDFTLNTDSLGAPIKLYPEETLEITLDKVTENGTSVSTSGYTLNLSVGNTKLTVSGATVTAVSKTDGTDVTVELLKDGTVVGTKTVSFKVLNRPVVEIDTTSCGTAPTMKVGEKLNLSTVAIEVAHGETITWASSVPAVATVTSDGVVTGVGVGKTIITATLTQQVATLAASDNVASIEVEVKAADTAATGNVTITKPATSGGDLTPPTFATVGYKLVKEGTTPAGETVYRKITTLAEITSNDQFVIVNAADGTIAMRNTLASNSSGRGGTANGSITTDVWKFDDATQAAASLWTFTGSSNSFAIASNEGHHLRNNGEVISSRTGLANSTIEVSATGFKINLEGSGRYLKLDGTEWTRSSSETDASEVLLFKATTPGGSGEGTPDVWGKLEGTAGFAYTVNATTAAEVKTAIQNGFTVTAAEDDAGTNAATVDMTGSRITIDTSALAMDTVGTYNVPVKLDDVEIGTVPVKVVAAETAAETHEFTVTMPTVAGVTVEAGKTLAPTIGAPTAVVAGSSTAATVNSYTIGQWSSANTGIATVDAATGEITGVAAGNTTITGKLTTITINNLTGTTTIAETLTVTVPVTVTAAATPVGAYNYVLDIDGIDVGVEYLIVAKVGDQYYAMKNLSTEVTGGVAADALLVTRNGETITIENETDALLSEWIFGGTSGQVEIKNIRGATNPVYVRLVSKEQAIGPSSKNSYVEAITGTPGAYYIQKEAGSGAKLHCTGAKFLRTTVSNDQIDDSYKLLLFKKRVTTSAISVQKDVVLDRLASMALTPKVLYQGALLESGYTLNWTSSNPDVVTAENGTLTAGKPGTATVTVKLATVNGETVTEDVSATINVTVNDLTMSLSQSELGLYLATASVSSQLISKVLTPTVRSAGVAWEGDMTITWSSSNPAVATVDQNGLVTALTKGTTTVTATLTGFNGQDATSLTPNISASCEVTVADNQVIAIELNPKTVTVAWDHDGETTEERQNKVLNALAPVIVSISYADGRTFNKTLGDLYTNYGHTDRVDTDYETAVNTNVTTATQYTVNVKIKGDVNTYDRNIYVRVVAPGKITADGIIQNELSVQYKLATELVDGKEYIIVAFPNGGTTNGVALSNGNATNSSSAQPLAVNVTLAPDGDYTLITLPAGTNTDGLLKWTFSKQSSEDNWFIYNFEHRLTASDDVKLLRARHSDTNRVFVEAVAGKTGAYYFTKALRKADGKSNYISYNNDQWMRVETATPAEAQQLYLYERIAETENIPVDLDVTPKTTIQMHEGINAQPRASVLVGGVAATQFNITWSSSNEAVAKVDANTGEITAVAAGDATITATLVHANGKDVIPNQGTSVTESVQVQVLDVTVTYSLVYPPIVTRLGGRPDYSYLAVRMNCDLHGDTDYGVSNPNVELDPLSAVDPTTGAEKPLNLMVPGDYNVPVYYQQKLVNYAKVTVMDDPYYGLTSTSAYPEYPDVGGIRIRKFGTGGQKFFDTGLANVELQVAGVSGQSNVDVVLVVDVSNSMAWTMDWFKTNPGATKDSEKIPASDTTPDKLDMAMQYAQEFADTLLGNGASGNTLSFVTFAGNDLDHRADDGDNTNYCDSVMTVFSSVTSAELAKASFAGTQFNKNVASSDGHVDCYLTIAGTDGQAVSNANGKNRNRGNTNYDYAFGQAIDAVQQVKDEYSAANGGKRYEDSGRQIHVVFMTDGAPSHYNGIWNGKKDQSKIYATLWGDPNKNRYTAQEHTKEAWLDYIGWYNRLATQLYSQITEMHVVGFDLAHGGYSGFSADAKSLNKVLQGLVQNRVLTSVQADDEAALQTFFADLAANLTYSATNAKVTDTVGADFDLYTGAQGNDTTKAELPQIVVRAYDLWKASDVGVGCTEEQVGERKGEEEFTELEHVRFYDNGTRAVSGKKPDDPNILKTNAEGKLVLEAQYFTYDFESKTFTWNIGNVEDKEYTLTYLAYLKNSVVSVENDADGNAVWATAGRHYTNEKATLDYVDINGRRASRLFPMPEVAWKESNIGVRFYLVDKDGNYVNSAGQTFTQAANRVFLSTRKYYQFGLDGLPHELTAADVFTAAALGSNYKLYTDGTITVKADPNDTKAGSASITGTNTNGRITAFDLVTNGQTGNFLHTIVDIPVVLESYGTAATALNTDTVVMDYGLPMPIDVLANDAGRKAANQAGTEVDVKLSILGFVPYDANFDPKNYIGEHSVKQELDTEYGRFSRDNGQVLYTPNKILAGVEKVFVAVKLEPSVGQTTSSDFRILLNPLTVVPATSVYYETDVNMRMAFDRVGNWTVAGHNTNQENRPERQALSGGIYGYDAIYSTCNEFSNNSAYTVTGAGTKHTNVTFTFTGTGFDIISRTGADEGIIYVTVEDASGATVMKKTIINTATSELYQIPVVSVGDLSYGTYKVTVGVMKQLTKLDGTPVTGSEFCFDAVRIVGAASNDEDAKKQYKDDHEANAKYQEIRDLLISNTEFWGAQDGMATGAFFMDLDKDQKDPTDPDKDVQPNISNYTDFGPKNEVYLQNGNLIAFKLTDLTNLETVHIGAKSADGKPVTMNITLTCAADTTKKTETLKKEIKTATDMFYGVTVPAEWDLSAGIIVTVSCTTAEGQEGGYLSLTHMKTTYRDAEAAAVNVVSDIQTYVVARNLLAPSYDVQAASFDEDTAMTLDTTVMTVVTTNLVDSLTVTDSFGNAVPASAIYLETEMGERIWTVTLRTANLGEVSYTVTGHGAAGQTGDAVSDSILVSY